MNLHINDFQITIPDWLLILLLTMLLIQTIVSLIGAYYRMKLAKLKRDTQKLEAKS